MNTTTTTDFAELQGLDLPERPDGPGAAFMLSAGIGCFVLGLFTTLDEASPAVDAFLAPWGPGGVGPLGGKVGLAMIAYVVSLAVLLAVWWKKDLDIKRWFWISVGLGCLGVLLTFPLFFQMFAPK
jgi:hypothetical protein